MPDSDLHVVTGAFGFSGQYIARRLLDCGRRVRTLTDSPKRKDPFSGAVEVHPFHFDQPEALAASLQGADVLYNTYWVRFNAPGFSHSQAVANTQTLFEAARKAGVRRVVHVSITNPSEESPLEYFRGKGQLERALRESGLSYAILRPAVLFGHEDILINNIAWMLRKFPVFGVFGNGRYRLQPIYVDDLAALAVEQGQRREDVVINAIGPETFTFRELAHTLGELLGCRRRIVSIPPWLGYAVGRAMGTLVGDVVLTREEIEGLMADLLYVDAPAAGPTRLTDWVRDHASTVGRRYASELARRRGLVPAGAAGLK
jgi:NADH dehydrogenase